MKIKLQLILVCALTFCLVSCGEDDLPNELSYTGNLIAIQEVTNNSSTTNYSIENNLNTNIAYSNGAFNTQEFNDGVVTRMWQYNNQNVIVGKLDFEYDAMKRLLEYNYYSAINGVEVLTSTTSFIYTSDKVFSTDIEYDPDGSVSFTSQPNIFTLNSNNQIIKYEDMNTGGIWEATYLNGNLASVEVVGYGNKNGTATFSYSDEPISTPFMQDSYRFGTNWKLNTILYYQQGGYSFKILAELSTNYLTGYVHLNPDGSHNVSAEINYEFDSSNRISVRTYNKLFGPTPLNYVTTYVYQ